MSRVNKISGECSCLFLQVSGYLGLVVVVVGGVGGEMMPTNSFVLGEVS